MIDVFCEETAICLNAAAEKKKYYVFKVLSIIFFIISVLLILIVLYTYDFSKISEGSLLVNILFLVLPVLSGISIGILFLIFKNRYCVDYDYTFVSGSIRISKIIKEIKRKNLYKFESSAIEKIGKYGSDSYNGYIKLPNVKVVAATSNKNPAQNKEFFYMVVNGLDQHKIILILECSETFIANVLKFANRYVLEKDYK